ncbi:hypothetical protein GBA52_011798 [Prunus armeniaca]|nr:hypothetical protein GBA52_011798 [Prunus armeniaca]
MQPFSYVSGIPNEAHEKRQRDTPARLCCPEKRLSLQAHYKKVAAQRAAALLEQANANAAAAVASDNAPEPKSESQDLKTVVPTSEVVVNEQVEKEEEKVVEEPTKKEEAFTGNTNGYSDTEMDKLASSRVQVADIPATHEPQVLAENSAEPELSSQMHNAVNDTEVNGMELSGTPQSEKPLLKEKEEIEIGKFRQTLCFKARPLPDFYKERKSQKSEIDKWLILCHRSLEESPDSHSNSKRSLRPQRLYPPRGARKLQSTGAVAPACPGKGISDPNLFSHFTILIRLLVMNTDLQIIQSWDKPKLKKSPKFLFGARIIEIYQSCWESF